MGGVGGEGKAWVVGEEEAVPQGEDEGSLQVCRRLLINYDFVWLINTIQYNAMQCNKIQCNTIQYNAIQYNTIQYNTIQYNTIQCNTIKYNTIQYNTIQYNTIQYKHEHYYSGINPVEFRGHIKVN